MKSIVNCKKKQVLKVQTLKREQGNHKMGWIKLNEWVSKEIGYIELG